MGCGSSRPAGAPVGMGALRVDVERPRGPAAPFKVVVMGDKGIGKSRRVMPQLPLTLLLLCHARWREARRWPLTRPSSPFPPRVSRAPRHAPLQRGRALYQGRLCRQHDGDHWRRLCHEGRARGRRLAGAAADLGCVERERDREKGGDGQRRSLAVRDLPARNLPRPPARLPLAQIPPARKFTAQ